MAQCSGPARAEFGPGERGKRGNLFARSERMDSIRDNFGAALRRG